MLEKSMPSVFLLIYQGLAETAMLGKVQHCSLYVDMAGVINIKRKNICEKSENIRN
ncbi:MAG: hypothetical protein PUA72_08895 [Lachnospiraceae bacterium]|nr:hypothetical protein [Lachnospiraceae bacterium]